MKIIVCLDEGLGMGFNHRRQSRDSAVTADIVRLTEGKKLYVSEYSEKLFLEGGGKYAVSDSMLSEAEKGEYCFVENHSLQPFSERIEEIVIYRWNRRYPADLFFDLDLEEEGFSMVYREEFEGSSHERITKEIFRR